MRRSQTVKKSQPRIDSRCVRRNLVPGLAIALRCWRQAGLDEDVADGGRRDDDAELAQLADDPQIAPAWVLLGQTYDQLTHASGDRWPARLAVRIGPLTSDE